MGFVENILTPFIQLTVYVVMVLWLIYMVYWVHKKLFPNLRWIVKYQILRSPYKEKDVEWCLDAIDRGKSAIRVKRFLLLKGTPMNRTRELMFILKQVQKKLQGGEDDGRKFRQSDEEPKEIPKVKS